MSPNLRPGILCLFLILPCFLASQDLSELPHAKPLKLSGSLSENLLFSGGDSPGMARRPLASSLSASLDLQVFGISLPFSAAWSNAQWSYQQPFNRFALHPSWKNLRGHAGDVSLALSPYGLNGMNFRGGALEFSSRGGWSFAGMYGRFREVSKVGVAGPANPAFKRYGYGAKLSRSGNLGELGIHLQYFSDEGKSRLLADSLAHDPEQNLVAGLAGSFRLKEKFLFQLEGAGSWLSVLPDYPPDTAKKGRTEAGFPSRGLYAFKSALSWTSSLGVLGLSMERVEPGYRCLAAWYNQSDFMSYSLQYALALLEQKVKLSLSAGIWQNNLSGLQAAENKRKAGSFQLACTPSQKLSLNLQYTGFATVANLKNPFDAMNSLTPFGDADTLQYTELSSSLSLSGNYADKSEDGSGRVLQLFLGRQTSSAGGGDKSSSQSIYTGSLGCMLSRSPADFNLGLQLLFSQSALPGMRNSSLGPSLTVRKGLAGKKLRLNSQLAFTRSWKNESICSGILLCRMGAELKLKRHTAGLTLGAARRYTALSGKRSVDATLSLNWRVGF